MILVGGGSIIIGDDINGVGQVIRPPYFGVANAIGAAVGRLVQQPISVSSYLIDWKNQRGCRKDDYPRSTVNRPGD